MSPEQRSAPAVGSVAEEASRLVEAAAALLGSGRTPGSPGGAGSTHAAAAPVDQQRCTGCPWCRGRTFVDGLGADTFDQLADLVGAVADSLRAVADDRRAHPGPGDGPADGQGDGTGEGRT